MAAFRDIQTTFQNNETNKLRCIATHGHHHEPCDHDVTFGSDQKSELKRYLDKTKRDLQREDIYAIVRQLVCSDHSSNYYIKKVASAWQPEFPVLALSATPTPSPQRPRRTAPFYPTSPSPAQNTPSQHDGDRESRSPSEPRASSEVTSENIVPSIEPNDQNQMAIAGGQNTLRDLLSFEYSENDNEVLQAEGLDLENGLLHHQWGDSSADAGGELSKTRQKKVQYLPNGEINKLPLEGDASMTDKQKCEELPATRAGMPMSEPVVSSPSPSARTSTSVNEHRASLSPDFERRTSRYARSRSRSKGSRSPSTPPSTAREALAYATMEGDAMFDQPPQDNEDKVIELIRKPLNFSDEPNTRKYGWIYAIHDPKLDLVKIGFTSNPPKDGESGHSRFKSFVTKCKLTTDAQIIENVDQPGVLAFRRLEALVHADLRPHRWYFQCACGLQVKRGRQPQHYTEHHEWYEIPNDVAIKTINLWRHFIMQDPYGNLEYGKAHQLQIHWSKRLDSRRQVTADEKHEHHTQRIHRWNFLFQSTSSPHTSASVVPISIPAKVESQSNGKVKVKVEEEPSSGLSLHDIPPATEIREITQPLNKPYFALNDSHYSIPTTPVMSTSAVPPWASQDLNGITSVTAYSISDPMETRSSAFVQSSPSVGSDTGNSKEANGINAHVFAVNQFELAELFGHVDRFLRKERKISSRRSPYDDIYTFRWPFACAIILALHSSFVPPILSTLTWVLFLPCFIAELREWNQ